MCTFNIGPCYKCVLTHAFRPICQYKWYALLALLFVVSMVSIIIAMHTIDASLHHKERDAYAGNALEKSYQDSLSRWYNFNDGVEWYNGKILSPNSKYWERYMSELRRDWILWKYNSNESYNLENPEVKDQSMGQASVIRKVLKDRRNGFFVECGAYDGETRSNTLLLEREFGWTGLLVEADPLNFSKMLHKNRKAYLTPTCLGIQRYPTVSSFLMARNVGRLHEPNSTDSHLPNSPDVAYSGVHISVQCFPFVHYMNALNVTTVDYFSLDIEGNELNVLKTIPFDMINIETLSVEFSHVEAGKKEMIDFMESKGYYVYSFVVRSDKLAHDIIFVKHEYEPSNSLE